MKQARLQYCDGRSDKVYNAAIVEADNGYRVEFSYGRRGSALTAGTKTPTPVALEKAETIFAKLVKEKLDKGYVAANDADAPAFTSFTTKEASGLLPQLLNPVANEEELEGLLNDPDWIAQRKLDGERRMIDARSPEDIRGINRKGQVVPLLAAIADAVSAVMRSQAIDRLQLDGEQVGDVLHVFDVMAIRQDLRDLPFEVRYEGLAAIIKDTDALKRVPVARSAQEKRALLSAVRAEKGEGIVLKRGDAAYVPGRPNSGGDQRKFKLVESATIRVCPGREGKRSIGMEVIDTDTGLWQFVGNCTIPPNHAVPEVGTIVEVQYLYCVDWLYQPVYIGPRHDQDASDCTRQKLKFKPKEAS